MTQTPTTITVDSLPIASSIDPIQDRLLIYTSSATDIQGISRNTLLGLASQPLGLTDTQSPTNKTFNNTNVLTILDSNFTIQNNGDNTKQAMFQLSGITTGNTRNYTLPDYNATLATLAGTETLTNKTLTAPTTTAITNTGGLSTNAITVSGNETVGGTLGVTGNTTLMANLSVGGTSSFTGTVTLPNNSVTAVEVATNAITLASISSSTSQGSITSAVLLTGLTTTVTIPAGGRTVRVEVFVPSFACTQIATATLYLYNSTTVTGSAIQAANYLVAVGGATGTAGTLIYEYMPAAGSQSYCAALKFDTGTGSTGLSSAQLAYLTVKVV